LARGKAGSFVKWDPKEEEEGRGIAKGKSYFTGLRLLLK